MIPCPSCQKPASAERACESCGADLQLARMLDAIGRLCFNRALEMLAHQDLFGAEHQLCAACALMPFRLEGHRALGKLRAQLGRLPEASVSLRQAQRLAPADPDTLGALAEVERLLKRERNLLIALPVLLAVLTVAAMAFSLLAR